MDEFIKRLTELRQGAGNALGKGVDAIVNRQQGVTDANRERNIGLVQNAAPTAEGYRAAFDNSSPLFDSPYKGVVDSVTNAGSALKDLLSRLMNARGN